MISALIGFFPWYAGLARGGVAKIGQIQLLQPLLTLAWSALLLERAHRSGHDRRIDRGTCERCGHPADQGDAEQSASLGNVGPVSEAPALEHISSGKVRDIYAVGEDRLLLVASDRISTYDVVHPTPIPDKGKVLTGLTAFWLERTGERVPEPPDLVHGGARGVPRPRDARRAARDGAGRVRRARLHHRLGLEGLPGHRRGLRDRAARRAPRSRDQLPEPIFTPATKAEVGDHDENVDFDRAAEIIGDRALLEELRRLSIAIYELGAAHARERGIILADTKFEFGRRADGTIVLGDEVLTPDSSRFWPADGYEPGHGQPSFDKQYVRDWASGSGWDKTPPAPPLPDDVIARTRELYVDAYERITGEPFEAWLERSA